VRLQPASTFRPASLVGQGIDRSRTSVSDLARSALSGIASARTRTTLGLGASPPFRPARIGEYSGRHSRRDERLTGSDRQRDRYGGALCRWPVFAFFPSDLARVLAMWATIMLPRALFRTIRSAPKVVIGFDIHVVDADGHIRDPLNLWGKLASIRRVRDRLRASSIVRNAKSACARRQVVWRQEGPRSYGAHWPRDGVVWR